jgi:hypothetical protein
MTTTIMGVRKEGRAEKVRKDRKGEQYKDVEEENEKGGDE